MALCLSAKVKMRPSYEDITRLVNKMREGSTEARREIIEAHVGLAFKAAQEFEDDEALSDALFELIEAVDRFRTEGEHASALPSYLKKALTCATRRHKRSHGSARDGKWGRAHHDSRNDAKRFMHSGRSMPEYGDQKVVDLMDQILGTCETEEEKSMVYWKSTGMTYAEVADAVGCSTTHVARSISRLCLRFNVQERLHA